MLTKRPLGTDPEFDRLYPLLSSAAERAVASLGANDHEKADAAQLTMIKLFDIWDNPKIQELRQDIPHLKNYVRKMARNRHHSLMRSNTRRQKREKRSVGIDGNPLPERPGLQRQAPPPDTAALPDIIGGFEKAEARSLIAEYVMSLPAKQQEVMVKSLAGRSPKEIAKEMGIDPQTARYHRRLAVKKLTAMAEGAKKPQN